jgi:hypothetical protein
MPISRNCLNSAQVQAEVRERKREQERTFETIRSLMESGKFDDATLAVEEALKTNVVEAFDPRIQRLSEHIKERQNRGRTEIGAHSAASDPSKHFPRVCFPAGRLLPSAREKMSCQLTSAEKASANELALSPQPVAPLPSAPTPAEKTSPQLTSAEKTSANELALSSQTIAPVAPLAVVQPRPATVVLPLLRLLCNRRSLVSPESQENPASHRASPQDIESVDLNADGIQAIVKGQMSEDYTPKGDKTKRVKNATVFHLAKLKFGHMGHHGCSVGLTETPVRSLDNLEVTYKLAASVTSTLNPSFARS